MRHRNKKHKEEDQKQKAAETLAKQKEENKKWEPLEQAERETSNWKRKEKHNLMQNNSTQRQISMPPSSNN